MDNNLLDETIFKKLLTWGRCFLIEYGINMNNIRNTTIITNKLDSDIVIFIMDMACDYVTKHRNNKRICQQLQSFVNDVIHSISQIHSARIIIMNNISKNEKLTMEERKKINNNQPIIEYDSVSKSTPESKHGLSNCSRSSVPCHYTNDQFSSSATLSDTNYSHESTLQRESRMFFNTLEVSTTPNESLTESPTHQILSLRMGNISIRNTNSYNSSMSSTMATKSNQSNTNKTKDVKNRNLYNIRNTISKGRITSPRVIIKHVSATPNSGSDDDSDSGMDDSYDGNSCEIYIEDDFKHQNQQMNIIDV